MRTITKLSLKLSSIIMVGLMTFTGCQKEIEKVKVNKTGNAKSMVVEYEDFGNVALGHFHNDHLDRLTIMNYFPINPIEKQYSLIKEYYHQYFPQDLDGLTEVSPEKLTEIIKPMFSYDDLKVYVEKACDAQGVDDITKDYLCNIMEMVYYEGKKVAEVGKFERYLDVIRDFKKKVDIDENLGNKERTMITNTLTIAYYSGIYWNNAAQNVASPWYELFDSGNNGGQISYAMPKWLKIVVVVAVDVAAGAAGSVVNPAVGAAAATAGSGMAKETLQ